MANSLQYETSPYLLQHANNPVNWMPYGAAALALAKQTNKPILISIGYSSCHWCHVMEHESFEDPVVAQLMNTHFINIKVDREERPDLDHIYMEALQILTGQGGWPLNMFLTPDLRPVYGGTYFPPKPMHQKASWKEVLMHMAQAFENQQTDIESQATQLMEIINRPVAIKDTGIATPIENIAKAMNQMELRFDKQYGGFGGAPKFPSTMAINVLFQNYYYTKNETHSAHAIKSIDGMINGGIYDHLEGGLARYSTDAQWLAPHFEKMLYDNALLLHSLSIAYKITKNNRYKDVIAQTINFITTNWQAPEGGFYSALDADSEGEEGKYYTWSFDEINHILGANAAFFCKYYSISPQGNWEHTNILAINTPLEQVAHQHGIKPEDAEKIITTCNKQLLAVRDKRIKPQLDDKVILSWNALMIHSLCQCYKATLTESYKQLAIIEFEKLWHIFSTPIHTFPLLHSSKNGQAKQIAFLDDYSFLAQACIGLYEISLNKNYLAQAHQICQYVQLHFSNTLSTMYYYTSILQTDIVARKAEVYDSALPSPNSVLAWCFQFLEQHYTGQQYGNKAQDMLTEIAPAIIQHPTSFANWLQVYMVINKPINVVTAKAITPEHWAQLQTMYLPNTQFIFENVLVPAHQTAPLASADYGFTLCTHQQCYPPIFDIGVLLETIQPNNAIAI
jgi:uncharacterized protein YyaL (SSP411 family)